MSGVEYARPFQPPASLFWRARRLAALLFADWPLLGPAVEAAVRAFDAQVDADQRPELEAEYAAAAAAGDQARADALLATFTARVASRVRTRLCLAAVGAGGAACGRAPAEAAALPPDLGRALHCTELGRPSA